jgi:hypothetical protein
MATDVERPTAATPSPPARTPWSKRYRHGGIGEAVAIILAYEIFEYTRDHVMGPTRVALHRAEQLVRLEKDLGLLHEHAIQQHFLGWSRFLSFWNIYYGTIHFVVPLVALAVLYRRRPARYLRWRNTLATMELVALAAFIWLPLMPPRLMPPHYGFVDTAARYFNFGPQVKVTFGPDGLPDANAVKAFGNLYAAMPSLHVGWATWSALALLPLVRRWWLKALLLLYPCVTLFAVVVTANHWILDGVGGWIVLTMAWILVVLAERMVSQRRRRPVPPRPAPAG